jgi:hypothetical protein
VEELASWFERQRGRERRAVFLEDALLSDRCWAYGWYRLRYFLLRYGVAAILHTVAVLLLFAIFPRRAFFGIVLLQAATGLATSFWWGALEVMRGRVRDLLRSQRPHLVEEEIGRWLLLALSLAVATLAASAGWCAWRLLAAREPLEAPHLYALALVVGLALTLVTRCFHSGVYAVRRIYRPLAAIVIVQCLSFALLPALWPWLGAWSFGLSVLVSTLVTAGITLHYTARVYRFLGIRSVARGLPRNLPWGELLGGGASYALMKLDAFLVLAVFATGAADSARPELLAVLFAMGPSIQAGFDWAQLFYFDFKRLEIRPFANLRLRYERFLFRLAWLMGAAFWLFGTLTAAVALGEPVAALAALLLPFFAVRSHLALVQIRTFSEKRYAALLGGGVVLLVGLALLRTSSLGAEERLLGVSAAMLAALAFLAIRRPAREKIGSAQTLAFPEWLSRAGAESGPCRVRALHLETSQPTRPGAGGAGGAETDERWKHVQLARRIATRLGPDALVTVLHPSDVVWLERGGGPSAFRDEWLAGLGAGLIREIRDTEVEPDGRAALDAAARTNVLRIPSSEQGAPEIRRGLLERLEREFAEIFPEGACYDPEQPAPQLFRGLASRERRSILFEALRFGRDFRPSARSSRFEVTALCEAGNLRLLFVVDRRAPERLRARWRARVERAHLQQAVAPRVAARRRVRPQRGLLQAAAVMGVLSRREIR